MKCSVFTRTQHLEQDFFPFLFLEQKLTILIKQILIFDKEEKRDSDFDFCPLKAKIKHTFVEIKLYKIPASCANILFQLDFNQKIDITCTNKWSEIFTFHNASADFMKKIALWLLDALFDGWSTVNLKKKLKKFVNSSRIIYRTVEELFC